MTRALPALILFFILRQLGFSQGSWWNIEKNWDRVTPWELSPISIWPERFGLSKFQIITALPLIRKTLIFDF